MIGKPERFMEILTAARSVLAEKGFDATKVSEIVERAGVAKGTFYLYFPSKLDLVFALVREMREKILLEAEKVIGSQSSKQEELIQVIKAAFSVMENYNDVFPVFNAVSAFKTEHWKAEKEIRRPYYSFLKSLIESGQKSGEFRSDLNTEMISSLIEGMVEHVAHECFVYDSMLQIDDYIDTINQLLSKSLSNND
ncbi:TetR family transcriptional regulator [Lederbergia ruris]|uniref:TetR family transcriptional regulator n=1 Tax=Lederbergia ruris TaxID=217495 RepID=A0ABQ4KPY7_9BACI|nr:TetR/AcrR family transcriptional regulator [Lederbergia ruris]MBW8350574.1 TetR/AcrR family transcriptional regulator [Bacillus sp. IITD106]GIN59546.1 TetR family transcriptional regulator [Lederbergia ruris]